MKILVLNCGSSSIKYKLFEMESRQVLAQGGLEKINLPGSFLKITLPNGEKKILEREIKEHTAGVQFIFETLTHPEYGAVKSLDEINAVGHRVLHGGTKFSGSVLINDDVIRAVEECCDLGPLHNPANLKGIYAVQQLLPNVPQVAVFDTAFHQTMPEHAYLYPIPMCILQIGREIWYPPLWFPRNFSPLRFQTCLRIPGNSSRRFTHHYLPHR